MNEEVTDRNIRAHQSVAIILSPPTNCSEGRRTVKPHEYCVVKQNHKEKAQ